MPSFMTLVINEPCTLVLYDVVKGAPVKLEDRKVLEPKVSKASQVQDLCEVLENQDDCEVLEDLEENPTEYSECRCRLRLNNEPGYGDLCIKILRYKKHRDGYVFLSEAQCNVPKEGELFYPIFATIHAKAGAEFEIKDLVMNKTRRFVSDDGKGVEFHVLPSADGNGMIEIITDKPSSIPEDKDKCKDEDKDKDYKTRKVDNGDKIYLREIQLKEMSELSLDHLAQALRNR